MRTKEVCKVKKKPIRTFYVNIYLEMADTFFDFHFIKRQSSKLEKNKLSKIYPS